MDTGKITVAAFDFDGTLTRRDSLLPFLLYAAGPVNFAIKMTRASPALLAYAARLMRNDAAKEKLLRTFLHQRPLADIEAIGTRFARERVPAMLLDDAYARFLWHKRQGACLRSGECLLGPLPGTVGEVGWFRPRDRFATGQ
jgi:phosphatidylglycerophosphatase C